MCCVVGPQHGAWHGKVGSKHLTGQMEHQEEAEVMLKSTASGEREQDRKQDLQQVWELSEGQSQGWGPGSVEAWQSSNLG